jgi:hypothetical protein
MAYNVNVALGSSGSCCSCETTPPCSDCDEVPPPPPPTCDCTTCGYYNLLTACNDEAFELYGDCGKCVRVGDCEVVCGGTGSHGCYIPAQQDCFDLGCVPCTEPYEPTDPCYKLDATVSECICVHEESGGLSCCTYTPKICTDYDLNYYSDIASATIFCGGNDCYKTASVDCPTLSCYECKTCEDFGLSSTKLTCDPGFVLTTETPCGTKLTCYACVDAGCDCNDVGLANSCDELTYDPECEVCEGDTGYLPTPGCEKVYCYYIRSKTCSEISPEGITCYDCDAPTKDDNCYYMLETLDCLCIREGKADVQCCEEEPKTCQAIGNDKGEVWGDSPTPPAPCPCGECWKPVASGCPDTTGCYSCQPMTCWKITGWYTAKVGSPCCVTTANLTFSGACTPGAPGSVANLNMSGTFSVNCTPPPGCTKVWPDPDCGVVDPCCCAEYCTGKAPDTIWPIGDPAGVVLLGECQNEALVSFEFEDCNIPPGDLIIYVRLEKCCC